MTSNSTSEAGAPSAPLSAPVPMYAFHPATTAWILTDSTSDMPRRQPNASPKKNLRIATLNVLADCFPWFVKLAIASKTRFAALVKEIERLDADVLGLNEVTPTVLQHLLQCPFIQSNYYVSEVSDADRPAGVESTIRTHGCMMLTKYPVKSAALLMPERGVRRGAIIVTIRLPTGLVAFCSIHTIAYQTKENKELRVKQLEHAANFCKAELEAHRSSPDEPTGSIIMGDMNLHYKAEDAVVDHLNTVDLWAETHFGPSGDGDEGMTFDAIGNTMIPRYIPGEKRKMRLDRILCTIGCPLALIPGSPCRIWANTPVDAKKQIYLSDHFGLAIDMSCDPADQQPSGMEGHPAVKAKLQANAALPLEPLGFSRTKFAATLVPHSFFLAMRAVGLK